MDAGTGGAATSRRGVASTTFWRERACSCGLYAEGRIEADVAIAAIKSSSTAAAAPLRRPAMPGH